MEERSSLLVLDALMFRLGAHANCAAQFWIFDRSNEFFTSGLEAALVVFRSSGISPTLTRISAQSFIFSTNVSSSTSSIEKSRPRMARAAGVHLEMHEVDGRNLRPPHAAPSSFEQPPTTKHRSSNEEYHTLAARRRRRREARTWPRRWAAGHVQVHARGRCITAICTVDGNIFTCGGGT